MAVPKLQIIQGGRTDETSIDARRVTGAQLRVVLGGKTTAQLAADGSKLVVASWAPRLRALIKRAGRKPVELLSRPAIDGRIVVPRAVADLIVGFERGKLGDFLTFEPKLQRSAVKHLSVAPED